MHFTIFGASGFIGSNLGSYLRSKGHSVFTPGREEALDPQENLGHVIYAIGMTGDFRSRPFETVEAHITVLSRLIRAHNYDSWLYLSSTRLYGLSDSLCSEVDRINVLPGPDGIYDISKLLGESLCLAMQRPTIRVARLSNVYGAGQSRHTFLGSILEKLSHSEDIKIGESAISSKDYIAISEVVYLIEKIVLSGEHNLYNIASGHNTQHKEITEIIETSLNIKITFINNSTDRIFSKINVNRIKNDFNFKPQTITHNLPKILERIKNGQDRNCND